MNKQPPSSLEKGSRLNIPRIKLKYRKSSEEQPIIFKKIYIIRFAAGPAASMIIS